MKRHLWPLMIATGLICSYSLAYKKEQEQKQEEAQNNGQLKGTMNQIYSSINELKNFMYSDKQFSDPKNQQTIQKNLNDLEKFAKTVSHNPKVKAPGYRISSEVLIEQISETNRVFRAGNKSYARWMLTSSLGLCMSCHTQIPTGSKMAWDLSIKGEPRDSFNSAEFLYATRAFDEANDIYGRIIQRFPKNVTVNQLETALERKLAYYARVKRDPVGGISSLQRHLKNKKLPVFAKKNIESWIARFKEWSKQPPFDVKKATDKEILELVDKNMKKDSEADSMAVDNPKVVNLLRAPHEKG